MKKEETIQAPIVEVFETIQGEGRTVGTPSVFVRFWGCNLRCRFDGEDCDTPYAVHAERDKAVRQTPLQLAERVHEFRPKHIVWTGGEPTLYQQFIVETMQYLPCYDCEVETNGTIPITPELADIVQQFNMSVKLHSSNQQPEYDNKRINHTAIDTYPIGKSYFKFVSSSPKDVNEIKALHAQHPQFDVCLMPQGQTREELIENGIKTVELCLQNSWMYSPREHVMLWNLQRGK